MSRWGVGDALNPFCSCWLLSWLEMDANSLCLCLCLCLSLSLSHTHTHTHDRRDGPGLSTRIALVVGMGWVPSTYPRASNCLSCQLQIRQPFLPSMDTTLYLRAGSTLRQTHTCIIQNKNRKDEMKVCDAPNRDSVRATSAPADVLRKHHFSCDIWSSPLVIPAVCCVFWE